ncbi:MAG: M15 family metallopeptidase [Rhodobacteraceae bacterium]|jgi:hypothetical protein|nr:M15 family metallopeptidase [Paracoccaceae bacterium]
MREGPLIGPIIIAIGLIAAAIVLAVVGTLLDTADGAADLRLGRAEAESQALREEIARLDGDLRETRADLARLREEIALSAGRGGPTAPLTPGGVRFNGLAPPTSFTGPAGEILGMAEHPETEAVTETMVIANRRFNEGITQPRPRVMLELLGEPGSGYSQDCQGITNPALKASTETRQVGPVRVTMLKPALDSLERIMARLQAQEPDIFAKIGTAGALCVRFIRGSTSAISNHSWGTAIDLTLQGELDGFGDGGTQFGLLLLAELFNEEGWFWGATFGREDSMHFEVGEETLRAWRAQGLI